MDQPVAAHSRAAQLRRLQVSWPESLRSRLHACCKIRLVSSLPTLGFGAHGASARVEASVRTADSRHSTVPTLLTPPPHHTGSPTTRMHLPLAKRDTRPSWPCRGLSLAEGHANVTRPKRGRRAFGRRRMSRLAARAPATKAHRAQRTTEAWWLKTLRW